MSAAANRAQAQLYAASLLTAAALCLALAQTGGTPAAAPEKTAPLSPLSLAQKSDRLPAALRRSPLPGPFTVQVIRVMDGDTFEGRLRIWFGQEITTLVRLRNIDAPELKSRCAVEAQLAVQARQVLEDILRSGPVVLSDLALDKFAGRVVADVGILSAGENLDDAGALMLAGGYARPYRGGRRQGWCG